MSRRMKLDFTGVESFQKASEGEHVCKIASADVKQSQGGNDMIVVAYEVIKGEDKGARVFENYPLVDTALWKLKGMLQVLGMKADGKVQLDLDKLIGRTLIVVVKHEEYDGKTRARVDDLKKLSAQNEEDEWTDSEDVEDEVEEEQKPAKKAKPSTKKAPMNPPEDSEDDDNWEDDEEEKPAPKKPSRAAKPKATEKPAKKAKEEEDDDDWDDEWDE